MENLFLETRAAAQIREWCRVKDLDEEECDELLHTAYINACNCDMWDNNNGGYSGYLVERALKDNTHVNVDIDTSFMWANTPQGRDFWRDINNMRVPVPKKPV